MALKKKISVILIVLLVSAAAGWLAARYYFSQDAISDSLPPGVAKEIIEELLPMKVIGDEVTVKIFHPSQDEIIATEIKVGHSPLHMEMVEIVMTEYLKGLGEGFEGAKVLGVYRDRRNFLYIDLSDEFRKNFSGDARQEFLLLQSLYKTVVSNFPWVEDVRLLIEGKEIESIGGHFISLYGLKEIFAD
jgi:hypothetical protein